MFETLYGFININAVYLSYALLFELNASVTETSALRCLPTAGTVVTCGAAGHPLPV